MMRIGVVTAVLALLLTACAAAGPVVKPIEQVDIESWRADIIAWPSASSDPDMAEMYQSAVRDCDNSVDDLAARMGDPAVDPTLLLVGVSYVCPGEQQKVAEAMRELHNARSAN